MGHEYESINWDEKWHELVYPYLELMYEGTDNAKIENKYEKYHISDMYSRFYAEKLLEKLAAKNPKLQFSIYKDPFGGSLETWPVLVRKSPSRAITADQMEDLQRVSLIIETAITKKYPEGMQARDRILADTSSGRLNAKSGKGCLILFLIPALVTAVGVASTL